MGASNQEMVSNVHLNRMGVRGNGTACFFKPATPQERYCEISTVIVSDQSGRLHSKNNVTALPAVNKTVCLELNVFQFQLLKAVANFYDNLSANLNVQNSRKRGCRALNVPYPLPRPSVRYTPTQKYFSIFWRQ